MILSSRKQLQLFRNGFNPRGGHQIDRWLVHTPPAVGNSSPPEMTLDLDVE